MRRARGYWIRWKHDDELEITRATRLPVHAGAEALGAALRAALSGPTPTDWTALTSRAGGVPERPNGAVLKTARRESVSWVRIPPPPLHGLAHDVPTLVRGPVPRRLVGAGVGVAGVRVDAELRVVGRGVVQIVVVSSLTRMPSTVFPFAMFPVM